MSVSVAANQLWFLDSLVTIRVSTSDGQDGISILEHRMPYGSSAPLHLHRTEDEIFHLLEGELRVKVGDQERCVCAGDVVLLPKGLPHTYRVESLQGARCLTITGRGDFERFVRAVSRPAERSDLPEPSGPPSAEAIGILSATAAQHGIEIIGQPLR